MRFSQKAFLFNRTNFEFGPKKLSVYVDDGRLKVGFSVPYHEVGTHKSIKSFPERAVFRLSLAVTLAACVSYASIYLHSPYGPTTLSGVIAVVGALMCFASRYAQFDATQIPIASGNTILIFQDSQHHSIMSEIYKRRKAEMLRLYGEVDTLAPPQLELKKFRWLKEEGVVSEQEFEEARQKIDAAHPKPP